MFVVVILHTRRARWRGTAQSIKSTPAAAPLITDPQARASDLMNWSAPNHR
jgi:hypothetical protein